ncbi:MAG: isoprenylcysteine carboxylmethyltransferase family protein [Terriglobia bacterium]
MNFDQPFRIALIIGAMIVFPVAAYYRFRSQATGEKLDRRREGLFILIALRLAGLFCMLGMGAYMVNPSWMAWSSLALPGAARWAGVVVGAAGGGLMIWAFANLGKNLTDTVVTRREHRLVTGGPYRWVRHPFYDSVALCILGYSLAAANWFILLTGGMAFLLIVVRTRKEEAELLSRFGDSYRQFVARTGRFLPKL